MPDDGTEAIKIKLQREKDREERRINEARHYP